GWCVRLHARLAKVGHGIIPLLGREERPRGHLAETLAERFVKAEGIAAILEGFLPERTRGGQRTSLGKIPVTGNADGVVELFPAHEARRIPRTEDAGMIDRLQGSGLLCAADPPERRKGKT